MIQSTTKRIRSLRDIYRDRDFFLQLIHIAWPIAAQNFFASILNMIGGVMVGQLGDTSITAVGLANQVFFLFNLVMFGITSGSAIFTAQLWGKKDIPNIRRVLSLCLILGLSTSLIFMTIAQLFPSSVLSLFSTDATVIDLGSMYLRSAGWSFSFLAITLSFAAVMRSTGDVKTPMFVSMGTLGLNTILSYSLIFGKFGLPHMGVEGAAWAILISRIMECTVLMFVSYRQAQKGYLSPIAVNIKDLAGIDFTFLRRVLGPVLPVALNELLWSLGIAIYNAIYAHIGTQAYAAYNILGVVDAIAFVPFLAMGNACAIMVGNQIGAGEEHRAYRTAGRCLGLVIAGGLIIGGLIVLLGPLIIGLYKVSPQVIQDARKLSIILACFMWVRAANHTLILGVMRSGGDTRFSFLIDVGGVWLFGIPMALLGAFILKFPIYWVYLMVMTDEASKIVLGTWRYFSRKWINNLAETI